ncbi:MAG: ATP-binding protein [Flavitalea sp.]
MLFANLPIQKKLLRIVFLINAIVLFLAGIAFFLYEVHVFRTSTQEKLSTIGKIIASNSTAALAFDSPGDAKEILSALKTEPHIVAACLYDKNGKLFSNYLSDDTLQVLPAEPGSPGYHFSAGHVEGFEQVKQESVSLGTLYLKSDMGAIYDRLKIYAGVFLLVFFVSFLLAFLLVKILLKSISLPIMALAETARAISDKKDYSVRSVKMGADELGALTDTFNQMLDEIQQQDSHLKQFNLNLENMVRARTLQLESVNKELESFSYSVSHDLRAPLRAIVGFTSILEDEYNDKLDDEGKRITSVIRKNTVKMGRLIDDLLAFSRMSRQDNKKSTIDMQAMVDEVKASLVIPGNNEKIRWSIGELPPVNANPNMIKQVWENLIGNSIKYSGKKEQPCIEIGSFAKKDHIVFFVKDNGAGFDVRYSDKLFKVFQRLHTPEEFEGTGVGLALVDKIISREGGSVWAESELGKGACFYFSLPQA